MRQFAGECKLAEVGHPREVDDTVEMIDLVLQHAGEQPGGFAGDHKALDDPTPHDERYARLIDYTLVIKGLLAKAAEGRPHSSSGRYYRLANASLTLRLPADLRYDAIAGLSPDLHLAILRDIVEPRIRSRVRGKYQTPLEIERHGIRHSSSPASSYCC